MSKLPLKVLSQRESESGQTIIHVLFATVGAALLTSIAVGAIGPNTFRSQDVVKGEEVARNEFIKLHPDAKKVTSMCAGKKINGQPHLKCIVSGRVADEKVLESLLCEASPSPKSCTRLTIPVKEPQQ